VLAGARFEEILVTNTARSRAAAEKRLPANVRTLESAGLVDAAITSIHTGR